MAKKPTTAITKKGKSKDKEKSQEKISVKSSQKRGQRSKPAAAQARGPIEFPIVGIGASAGGLEAFEQFFTNMPPDSGMAFVLVQHLDPTHKSILKDLLRSYTRMGVKEVEDGMVLEPNNVYVIPPNSDMATLHGRLHLMEPSAPRGLRQPIDAFFRSLAEDRKEKAICIVLSGSGTEGAQGLREVKGHGGMVMVQDPLSAKYDGMPRSAIATGQVDYILTPQQMPDQLIAYVRHPFSLEPGKVPEVEPEATNFMQKILILVRSRTGQDFSFYKQSTIVRRIERRMAIHEIENLSGYLQYIRRYPDEVDTLFKELLIGVTNFFRDPEAFEMLQKKVIPQIVKEKEKDNGLVRVWVPGCSTGEEAYSLGILFREYMEQNKRDLNVQIFATDIDGKAVETARQAVYPHGIAVDVRSDRLRNFFSKHDSAYRIKKHVRDMVVFALQNVVTDPPFSKIDLISCRNLLIYMRSELQKKVLPIFHYSLAKGGFLFLGTSETVGEFSELFAPVDRKWKIFHRKDTAPAAAIPLELGPRAAALPATIIEPRPARGLSLTNQDLVEHLMLDTYPASAVLMNEKGDILYFQGVTGKYLYPPVGEATFNAVTMARGGLKIPLANALRKAASTKQTVRYDNFRTKLDDVEIALNLIVRPVQEPPSRRGLLLAIFEEVQPRAPKEGVQSAVDQSSDEGENRIREMEDQLASTKEYLQTTIEELETSNEELKSTNEELQSANEELQSTNEELETSKEEQQSVNEELTTVNSELQQKIDALSKANDDMTNLLAATQIGTIFLDTKLHIQRFTPMAKKIIPLLDSDVGRSVRDMAHNLEYDRLAEDAEEVLRTLSLKEVTVRSKTGHWYSMRVLPYRTTQNVIEGLVVTFVDITDEKLTKMKLQEMERRYQSFESFTTATWTCTTDGELTYLSEGFKELFGQAAEQYEGHSWLKVMGIDQSGEAVEKLLSDWKKYGESEGTWNHTFTVRDESGKERSMIARVRPIKDERSEVTSWVGLCFEET